LENVMPQAAASSAPDAGRSRSRRPIIRAAGATLLIGCLLVLIAHVAGIIVVDRHNLISETISRLAAGRHEWIQDWGLNALAIGIAAAAVGLFLRGPARWPWRLGCAALLLAAVDLVIIAEHNEYADLDREEGEIHQIAASIFWALMLLPMILLAPGFRRASRSWAKWSITAGVLWLILAPLAIYVVPTSWDGLAERIAALVLWAWLILLGWRLWRDETHQPDHATASGA
jgi:hypothetical protein